METGSNLWRIFDEYIYCMYKYDKYFLLNIFLHIFYNLIILQLFEI